MRLADRSVRKRKPSSSTRPTSPRVKKSPRYADPVLSSSPKYSKRADAGGLDPHEPLLAGGQPLAVGIAHVEVVGVGAPDRAGLREPGGAVDAGAVALGRRVVLVHDRAEPLDDRLLHRHRAGGRAVDDGEQRGDVVALAHLVRKGQEPVEHRRHEVHVRDPVLLDQRKGLLGVPPLHHHHRHAAAEGRHERDGERARRGTAARCRGARCRRGSRTAAAAAT